MPWSGVVYQKDGVDHPVVRDDKKEVLDVIKENCPPGKTLTRIVQGNSAEEVREELRKQLRRRH